MTILVLNLSLPEAFHPDPAGLVGTLKGLWPKFLPYALSFFVLGATWLANTKLRSTADLVGKRYVSSWLLYLFIATCLPFSTSVVGQFAHLKPAVWLYSVNMAALAAIGYRLVVLLPGPSDDEHILDRKLSLIFLMATSAACIALSTINPSKALWIYLLNLGEPPVARWMTVKKSRSEAH